MALDGVYSYLFVIQEAFTSREHDLNGSEPTELVAISSYALSVVVLCPMPKLPLI